MKLIDAKRDQYRKLAHEQGFRSRAAYKLKEINKSYRIIGPGSYVLDLGCAPGGWTQVAQKISGNQGKVLGIDLSFVEEIPNAKIIHVTRDPMDTCLSNYRNYFSSFGNGHAYDQIELADFYHQYRQLMHHWYSVFPKEIFQCDYDQLIANQENVSRTLIDFCNLSWEPKVLDFHKNERTVKTASVTQVRNKIYTSSVSGWKKYEKHLQPMYELLNEKGCLEPWNVDSYN